MKKYILILLTSFLFGSSCWAQYIPILGYSDVWLQQDNGNNHDCHVNNITQNITTTITANGHTYQILHETWNGLTDNYYYLREDCGGQKVYIYYPSTGQEELFYDFSLTTIAQTVTVYTTISPNFPVTLTVQNVYIDPTTLRKHIILSNPNFPSYIVEWVEGLGSLAGIIYNTLPYTPTTAWDIKLLLCHKRNGVPDFTPLLHCADFSCPAELDPNAPSITITTENTSICVDATKTITGTFGGIYAGNSSGISITHNGQGTLSTPTITGTTYSVTYTPVAADAGNNVLITIKTNTPGLSTCIEAIKTYELTVNPLPAIPDVTVAVIIILVQLQ